jgi:hypothetical protein
MTFDQWFAAYLKQDRLQIEHLLRDRMATRFLIAWSLFESRCFSGFVRVCNLSDFAKMIIKTEGFRRHELEEAGRHFHDRYQDRRRFKNLMHRQTMKEMEEILTLQFDKLSNYQLVFMLLVVIYRFRNNIFHGNKGVQTWLQYKEQITLCLSTMQTFISLSTVTHNNCFQWDTPLAACPTGSRVSE